MAVAISSSFGRVGGTGRRFFKWRVLSPLNAIAWPYAIVARVLYRSVATIFLAAIWAFVGFGAAYWYGWWRLACS